MSCLLIHALPCYRELAADRGSALITAAQEHLASALIHIDQIVRGPQGMSIPQKDFRNAQTVDLCIMPALNEHSIQTLLSTHPSLEQRLDQLQRMQQHMEEVPVP